jgi:pimeloyl-ACP methyl ester carboxylesterase
MLALLLAACVKPAPPTMAPEAVLSYETGDGWTAEIRHYPGEGPPVLLVHGMAASHLNWDFRPEVSLADYLQSRGWDVWVPELRGDPGSAAPSREAARTFSFDDYARSDLPAIVDRVLAETGAAQLYWVGHSMGGMLLYTALAQYPEKIAAGVAVSSPARFDDQPRLHRALAKNRWVVSRDGMTANRAGARAALVLGWKNPVTRRLGNVENLDPAIVRGLSRTAIVDLPNAVSREASDWLRSGDFVDTSGAPWLAPAEVPLLVMAGSADWIAPADNVAYACEVFPDCRLVRMGADEPGFTVDYGHIDPLLGTTSAAEVYPVIAAFLAEQRAVAAAEDPAR